MTNAPLQALFSMNKLNDLVEKHKKAYPSGELISKYIQHLEERGGKVQSGAVDPQDACLDRYKPR